MSGTHRHTVNRRHIVAGIAAACILPFPAPAKITRIPDPVGHRITRWAHDPFARGSYSYLARNAHSGHRHALAHSVDQTLFFAGEATNGAFPATVHGALLSGRRAARDVLATQAQRIAVIGAGIAGLAAASALSGAGKTVTVIEARDRIGGRVHTDRSLGTPVDLGASWIHGILDNPLTEIANRLGVARSASNFASMAIFDPDGERLRYRAIPDWFFERWEYDLDYAAGRAELSPAASLEGKEILGPHVVFPGGYDQLLPAFEGDYDVLLSNPIDAISHEPGVVQIAAARPVSADAAVVTLPLGVLKSGTVRFSPALSATKQDAIDRLGIGLLDKTYLRFPHVFWPADTHFLGIAASGRHPFAHWVNLTPHTGEPILCAFNGADTARILDDLSDALLVENALVNLDQMLSR